MQKKAYRQEVLGGILVIFSLFVLLTIIYPYATGIVGSFIVNNFLWNAFGKAFYISPLFFGLAGFYLLFNNSVRGVTLRLWGLLVFLVNLAAFLEMLLMKGPVFFTWPLLEIHGGLVGNILSVGMQMVFGELGAYFLTVVIALLSVMLIFLIHPRLLLLFLRNLVMPVRSNSRIVVKPAAELTKQRAVMLKHPVNKVAPAADSKKRVQGMFDLLSADKAVANTNRGSAVVEQPRPVRRVLEGNNVVAPNSKAPVRANNSGSNLNYANLNYKLPSISLLNAPVKKQVDQRALQAQFQHDKQILEETLASFKVSASVCNIAHGPSVTRYELMPSSGVRVSKIANLADDISLAMASTVRIEAPVPGKSVVGIEVPNPQTRPVNISEMVTSEKFQKHPLTVALGLDIAGNPIFCNLNEMPHILIAGATGAGKSVCINSLIMSILLKASPEQVKFLMIDPKRVELSTYNDLPHLVAPVVYEPNMAPIVLKLWAIKEMERRYEIFSKVGVRNIETYNKYVQKNIGKKIMIRQELEGIIQDVPYLIEHMPYVVIVIDELADLMMVSSKDVEGTICRLAQMARATGMHLVIATQRPSVDVITGLIKANVPSRISFAVGSQIDSRTIIDKMGAEKLLGKGDMLYSPVGARHLTRVQGVYVPDEEIQRVTNYIRSQSPPRYELDLRRLEDQARVMDDKNNNRKSSGFSAGEGNSPNQRADGRDVLFDEAAELIQSTGRNSISFVQRKLRIGYNRAARIVDELTEAGLVHK